MGLDPIVWVGGYRFTDEQMDKWRLEKEVLATSPYYTERWNIHTPVKTLTMVVQAKEHTAWVNERLLKDKNDVEILERFMPVPYADKAAVEKEAREHPDCLIRGTIPSLSPMGQPGCWQDLSMLYGIQDLIMETYDDPEWVKETLAMIRKKKLEYIETIAGCPYDLTELGGGDASTTVISPAIFDEFVAPYDAPLIRRMSELGQRTVYHTCGGMMPILERLADMGPNALETFTPVEMGGDAVLSEAKKRIGDRVCIIGGFDQFHYFTGCTVEDTRRYVRRCFEDAGEGGGFIFSPSDHFFDADLDLIRAFADEAANCRY